MSKLKIVGISKNSTVPAKENVKLGVLEDIPDLSRFAILDNTYKNNKLSNLHIHMFILPAIEVIMGDFVIVLNGDKENYYIEHSNNRNKTHYVFTKTNSPRLNETGDLVKVIEFVIRDTERLAEVD